MSIEGHVRSFRLWDLNCEDPQLSNWERPDGSSDFMNLNRHRKTGFIQSRDWYTIHLVHV